MPALDPLRRRICISEADLEYLRRHSNGETTPTDDPEQATSLASLTAAGLITGDGTVHSLVADLAMAMSQPMLELWIETMSERGPAVSHVVVRGDEDLWYTDPWPAAAADSDEVVFVKDELPQLLGIVSRLVGFRRGAPSDPARPVTTSLGTIASLQAAFSAETEGSWDDVRTVAIARLDDIFGAMSPEQREMWIAILATLEGTWRITCAWGPETRHTRGLAVWDCGPGGFWVRTTPAEPLLPGHVTGDTEATFVPTSGDDLWKALAELLPSQSELAEAEGAAISSLCKDTGDCEVLDWGAPRFSEWIGKVEAGAVVQRLLLGDKGELIDTGIHAFGEHQSRLEVSPTTARESRVRALRTGWLGKGITAVEAFYLSGTRRLFTPGTAMPWLKAQAGTPVPAQRLEESTAAQVD
jgi:hypothetical protein